MIDYTPKIPKKDLIHGQYYKGRCRNAEIAKWNAEKEYFVHWRYKWGETFLETIKHPEDDKIFDVFVVEKAIDEQTALAELGANGPIDLEGA